MKVPLELKSGNAYDFARSELAEKELEIDVEKVRHIIDNTVLGTDELATLKIKDFYPKGTGKRIAQAIAKEFPVRVVKND